MAHEIVVPRLGWSMEEGVFVRWLKHDGDFVRPGEALFELEGEKALTEIEAVDGGILRIPPDALSPGSVVPVGFVLGFLVAEGEATPTINTSASAPAVASEQVRPTIPLETHTQTNLAKSKQIASPRAKRVARELGVDWMRLAGSGAGGRVRERDVRAAGNDVVARGKRLPISQRRRVIAERLIASRQQTVPVTITTRADATQLVQTREQFKAANQSQLVPSYQDLIVKQLADVLARHPLLAARWNEQFIMLPADDEFHIGLAVDTDDGLLVPVVRDVRQLSLAVLAKQSRQLIEQAKNGQLSAAQMQGAVFTVTNLGAFGIDAFTPVINWPEAAILGLGAIRREAVVLNNGQLAARWQITLSLTFDHRLIDGAPAAMFLQELASAISSLERHDR